MRRGAVLAQSLLTYTPPGGRSEVEVGTSVDIVVKYEDREVRRTPNAGTWAGDAVARIDLEGKLKLLSYKSAPVAVEVRRFVLGGADSAGQQGVIDMLDVLGGSQVERFTTSDPSWLSGYSWPAWWGHFNGRGRITWTPTLQPGKPVEFDYTWHYFWR